MKGRPHTRLTTRLASGMPRNFAAKRFLTSPLHGTLHSIHDQHGISETTFHLLAVQQSIPPIVNENSHAIIGHGYETEARYFKDCPSIRNHTESPAMEPNTTSYEDADTAAAETQTA